MIGVLLIDKPAGPTSHDVVARLRRTTGERAIGHTGTLDPRATGLLPLVLGKATRLSSLLTGRDKTYEATVRLGVSTTTDDSEGAPTGPPSGVRPTDEALDRALAGFLGTFDQIPPSHSAKKVGGRKAYELARRDEPVALRPVSVTVHEIERLGRDGDDLRIRVRVSTGFYVRALARDQAAALGCGAHLAEPRRTRVGTFRVEDAVPLEEAERMGTEVAGRVLSPAAALPELPAVELNQGGLQRVLHGNAVGPDHLAGRFVPPSSGATPVRLLGPDGRLVALGHSRGGALHPVVVLG